MRSASTNGSTHQARPTSRQKAKSATVVYRAQFGFATTASARAGWADMIARSPILSDTFKRQRCLEGPCKKKHYRFHQAEKQGPFVRSSVNKRKKQERTRKEWSDTQNALSEWPGEQTTKGSEIANTQTSRSALSEGVWRKKSRGKAGPSHKNKKPYQTGPENEKHQRTAKENKKHGPQGKIKRHAAFFSSCAALLRLAAFLRPHARLRPLASACVRLRPLESALFWALFKRR